MLLDFWFGVFVLSTPLVGLFTGVTLNITLPQRRLLVEGETFGIARLS